MGHLDELHAKYRDKGVVILAVTNEARGLVDKFIADTGSKHPILIEESDSAAAFGIDGFPSSFLIDPNGKIVWAGHPASLQEADIDRLLPQVRLVPQLTKKLAGVQKSLEKGEYASAQKSLDGMLGGAALDDADRRSAEEATDWLKKRGASMLQSADADAQAGDYFSAAETLRRASALFKGLEPGDRAKASLDALMKDEGKKKEIDAGDAYGRTKDALKKAKPEQAAAAWRQFAKKYEGTRAGERATAEAVKLEAKGRR